MQRHVGGWGAAPSTCSHLPTLYLHAAIDAIVTVTVITAALSNTVSVPLGTTASITSSITVSTCASITASINAFNAVTIRSSGAASTAIGLNFILSSGGSGSSSSSRARRLPPDGRKWPR
jgi:hypothetical protein